MIIGICRIEMLIYDSNSLKEKRQVIKSVIERIKHRYNVSIAEEDKHDTWNIGVIGMAVIGNDSKFIDKTIMKIIDFIDGDHRVEIIEQEIEIM